MTQKNTLSEELKISIINYLCGKWDECNTRILIAWLEEDDENKYLFRQLVNLWESEQLARQEKHFNPDHAWAKLESTMKERTSVAGRFSGLKQIARYAAVFILALILGGAGHYLVQKFSVPGSSEIVEYVAPYGSKTNLKLVDGSLIWLNAGTTLKYDQEFGRENRDIELNGEAYFEVAKNKKLPFIVKTKKISVRALGTKFNVKAYPEEKTTETILLEGSVRIWNQTAGKQKNILLEPDQKAIFHTELNDFAVSDITNTSDVSWFTDKWVVKNKNLEEFAKLLERRYNIRISFSDDRIRNYEFGGTIMDETIEQVLTAITYSAPVKYKIINKQVTLSIDENKLNKYKSLLK